MKIWGWQCNRYLRNNGSLPCKKFQCPKFRHTEVIHKNLFSSFLEMHNYVWYLWTCPNHFVSFISSLSFNRVVDGVPLVHVCPESQLLCHTGVNFTVLSVVILEDIFVVIVVYWDPLYHSYFGIKELKLR